MANNVANEVVWSGLTPDQDNALRAKVLNKIGEVDFELLLPIPLNAWQGDRGLEHLEAFGLNSLDWCKANWGTKWNAYSCLPCPPSENGRLRLAFQTAWRPPYGWLAALLNHFGLPFDHHWLDEGEEKGRVGRFEPASSGKSLWPGSPHWRERDAAGAMQRHLDDLLRAVGVAEDGNKK